MHRYKTLLSAALSGDSAAAKQQAAASLAPLLQAGAIDSIDQWASLSAGSAPGKGGATAAAAAVANPRTEVVLAGIDSDKKGAAIRIGDYKLLVGDWGADTWCDLNSSGLSPVWPAPPQGSIGGEGGLVCIKLNGTHGPSSSKPFRVPVCAARALNATGQARVTLSLLQEHF